MSENITANDLPMRAFATMLTYQRECKNGHAAILVKGDDWKVRQVWPNQACGMFIDGYEIIAVVKGAP